MRIITGKIIELLKDKKVCLCTSSISIEQTKRKDGRPGSIRSVDSVNLDELINANYTADMDDETDLPDLANLDIIDDSTEDFWNLNPVRKEQELTRLSTNLAL